MSHLEAAIAAEMRLAGCSPSKVDDCREHPNDGRWSDRDACPIVASAVRAGWDAAINDAAEVERLREQVETLQAERDAMTEIYAIEVWVDTGDSMSGWAISEVFPTGKHDALQRLHYLCPNHTRTEFRLAVAQITTWMPVADDEPTDHNVKFSSGDYRYPYSARCSCGWASGGLLSLDAVEHLARSHQEAMA